jgi:hypothetical protein
MVDVWKELCCVGPYIACPSIDQYSVLTSVDKETGVRCGDLSEGKGVLAQGHFDLLLGDISKKALKRIIEVAIANRDTFECTDPKTKGSRVHHYPPFTSATEWTTRRILSDQLRIIIYSTFKTFRRESFRKKFVGKPP